MISIGMRGRHGAREICRRLRTMGGACIGGRASMEKALGEKGLADAPFSSDSLTRKPLTVP